MLTNKKEILKETENKLSELYNKLKYSGELRLNEKENMLFIKSLFGLDMIFKVDKFKNRIVVDNFALFESATLSIEILKEYKEKKLTLNLKNKIINLDKNIKAIVVNVEKEKIKLYLAKKQQDFKVDNIKEIIEQLETIKFFKKFNFDISNTTFLFYMNCNECNILANQIMDTLGAVADNSNFQFNVFYIEKKEFNTISLKIKNDNMIKQYLEFKKL